MKRSYLICSVGLFTMLAAMSVTANDWPQWRGPRRDGISQETGLLKEWPNEGPKLLWLAKDIGSGYSTPAVVGERLYLLGNEGLENEFVEALPQQEDRRNDLEIRGARRRRSRLRLRHRRQGRRS